MIQDIFKYKKANGCKLTEYGFVETNGIYRTSMPILDKQFELHISITNKGEIKTQVIDSELGEEYTLHLSPYGVGEFVGKVRAEYERILTDVCDKCFDKDVFKSEQAKEIINLVKTTYGDEPQYLWEKFDNNAVFRRQDNNKWYGVLVADLDKTKLGIKDETKADVLVLRINPAETESTIDNRRFFKAYHMNKQSWFSLCLDESVATTEIMMLIDKSYELANKK